MDIIAVYCNQGMLRLGFNSVNSGEYQQGSTILIFARLDIGCRAPFDVCLKNIKWNGPEQIRIWHGCFLITLSAACTCRTWETSVLLFITIFKKKLKLDWERVLESSVCLCIRWALWPMIHLFLWLHLKTSAHGLGAAFHSCSREQRETLEDAHAPLSCKYSARHEACTPNWPWHLLIIINAVNLKSLRDKWAQHLKWKQIFLTLLNRFFGSVLSCNTSRATSPPSGESYHNAACPEAGLFTGDSIRTVTSSYWLKYNWFRGS